MSYIKQVSEMCTSNYGSLLLQLLALCDKTSIQSVTEEEAKQFIDDLNSGKVKPEHIYGHKEII